MESKKYIQSWVEKKGNKKYLKYYAVLRSGRLFFLTSEDTHNKDKIAGHLDITGTNVAFPDDINSKKKAFCFCIIGTTSEYFVRVPTEELRTQWLTAIQQCGEDVERFQNPTGSLRFTPGQTTSPPSASRVSLPPTPPTRSSIDQRSPDQRPLPTIPNYNLSQSSFNSNDDGQLYGSIDEHPCASFGWYFGSTPRDKAEQLLIRHGSEGAFFVRASESTPGNYTLTGLEEGVATHYRISAASGGTFLLTGEDKPFADLPSLVKYYENLTHGQPLDKNSVERLELAFNGSSTIVANAVLPGMLVALQVEEEARIMDAERHARQQARQL
eukprot:m.22369 g.22369  ORF g.22369 m.22369 type:complete len:327 (+) comp13799_c0_seq1:255-1235(+)